MQAEDFLQLAGLLAAEDSEAAWRTAVSRSYYAAFHVARKLLQWLGFTIPRNENAHVLVRSLLDGSGQIDVQQAGEKLRDLRRYRNWADYDLDRLVDQADAMAWVTLADTIVRVLTAAREEPFRSRIAEGIRRYETHKTEDDG